MEIIMEKVLLTGGTGYIGSHTAVELIEAGYEVEILDNLCNSKIKVLDKIEKITGVKPKFYEVDLLDKSMLMEVMGVGGYDAVMHFAGLKAVGESVEQPLKYYENNLIGTMNLLEAMKETEVKKIVFSSSATVYGDRKPPYTETVTTGVGISNPYGWTKFMIEEMLKDEARADAELEVMILRYFNPIGAHSSGLIGEDPNGRPNNLMPIVMKVAKGEIAELPVYGDDYETPDGTCVRDYIHVVDLAQGHVKALEKMDKGVQIYNLGTGKGVSVMEIVKAFEKESGKKLPHEIVGRRPGDLAEIYAVPTLAEKKLGWKAELGIKEAMRDTLNFLEHGKKVK